MIQAILFDLDGVLWEGRDLHFTTLNEALKSHNYQPISLQDHIQEYNGLPTRIKLSKLHARGLINPEDIESIAALKQKETQKLIAYGNWFSPDKYCLIAGLKAKGYLLGVVTNSISETTQIVLESMRLRGFISVIISNEIGEPKPSPYPYSLACSTLRTSPQECLAVEDGEYGCQSALAAGCKLFRVGSPDDVTPKNLWSHLC